MAGASKGGKGGKNAKTKKDAGHSRPQYAMRVVDSATCAVCKSQCERGLRYLAKMAEPGAVGKGVPCILTRKLIN
ncbi:hypothetical protein ACFFK0_07755 [Paenibacillus chartarius]|uniref:Uncharacterized protein n=1 Tax=Paenibacillus chartarius TaxID=747481 RepID=A0ABV6DI72_9BACL